MIENSIICVLIRQILIMTFIITIISCRSQELTPLIAKDETNENEKKNTLYVFVGEKVELTQLPYIEGSMDVCFKAKYKILQSVYGSYHKNFIEFLACDHYGIPDFSNYKNVLLFVSEKSGKYYHEKYQYNAVYKTKNGRWAGLYASHDYEHPYNKNTKLKPQKIEFAKEVSFPTIAKNRDGEDIEPSYPEPYYKTIGNKAIAIYGNYIEDLFKLKKEGLLTARELFGHNSLNESENNVEPPQLAPISISLYKVDSSLIPFWKNFSQLIKRSDIRKLREITLDSLVICDKILPSNHFFSHCYTKIFNRKLLSQLKIKSLVNYTWTEVDTLEILNSARNKMNNFNQPFKFLQVKITADITDSNLSIVNFNFISTTLGYKLYGLKYYNIKKCCADFK